MKHVKMLGLAAMATMALMAFVGAGTASATTLTGVGGGNVTVGTEIHAVLESGTIAKLETSFKNIECEESTVAGKTTNETGETVTGNISTLTFGKCNCEVKVLKGGTLHIAVNGNGPDGSVSSSGAEVTSSCSTILGTVHCIYATGAGTALGTLTGSQTTGTTATMDIVNNNIPRLTTSAACAEKAIWNAKYSVTTPDVLNVKP